MAAEVRFARRQSQCAFAPPPRPWHRPTLTSRDRAQRNTDIVFSVSTLLERYVNEIDALAFVGRDQLLVGTAKGEVAVFRVVSLAGNVEVSLLKNSVLSRKPISRIEVMEAQGLFVILANGYVCTYSIATHELKQNTGVKGASVFCLDQLRPVPRLCIGVENSLRTGRSLQLLDFTRVGAVEEFRFAKTLATPEDPLLVQLAGDYLWVGLQRMYLHIHIDSGATQRRMEDHGGAVTLVLPDEHVLLAKDTRCIAVGFDASVVSSGITWSSRPLSLAFSSPYVIGLLKDTIEVRALNGHLIQTIKVPRAKAAVCTDDAVYVATAANLYHLSKNTLEVQVTRLYEEHLYETALAVAQNIKHYANMNVLRRAYAYDLFLHKKLEDAMRMFIELDEDPVNVIGLFPNILAPQVREQLTYPFDIPELTGSPLALGYEVLTQYLVNKRKLLSSDAPETDALRAEIDTALVMTYLRSNPSLLGPFLRLPNACVVARCEPALRQAQLWGELVELYFSKAMHKQALTFLSERSGPGSLQKIVAYLVRLGRDQLPLILQYSAPVLQADPKLGLSVFTAETDNIANLPQREVLDHIRAHAGNLVQGYLEHIIYSLNNVSEPAHSELARLYLDRVRALTPAGPPRAAIIKASAEPGEFGAARRTLLKFLTDSEHYDAVATYHQLSRDGGEALNDERACVLAKLSQHKEALTVYVRVLGDVAMAEACCERYYRADNEISRNIYLAFLEVLLRPDAASGGAVMMDEALHVLNQHWECIELPRALDLLPPSTRIIDILPFLSATMQRNADDMRSNQLKHNLWRAENLQMRRQHIREHERFQRIDEDFACGLCRKRIVAGQSFFCYPDGSVVHHKCADHDNLHISPITHENFLARKRETYHL